MLNQVQHDIKKRLNCEVKNVSEEGSKRNNYLHDRYKNDGKNEEFVAFFDGMPAKDNNHKQVKIDKSVKYDCPCLRFRHMR